MDNLISIRFHYRGRVQGVWFRKTAQEIAGRVGATGYVRNLPDGSVEAVVRGTPQTVDRFAEGVSDHYRENISDCTRVPCDDAQGFTRFEIRD